MAHPSDPFRRGPYRDLATFRDMVTAIRNDLQRLPGLETASGALTTALEELALAEHRLQPLPLAVRVWSRPPRGH
jgi:hypothetical protein